MLAKGDDFDLVAVLSSSSSSFPGGKIHLVKKRKSDSDSLLVLKRYDLDAIQKAAEFEELANYATNEAVLMRQFKHRNLLPFLGSFVRGHEVITVTPWMKFGSVRDLLDTHFKEGLPETAIAFLLRDVCKVNRLNTVTRNKTRRKHRQRPAAKLIGPNCNGIPWPIKLSTAMLKISIAQQQQQEE